MKAIRLLVILAVWLGCVLTSHSNVSSPTIGGDDVIRLERISVTAYFDVNYSWDPATKSVISARVTWVAPRVKKLGVRIGGYVDGVDGTPVDTMTVSDFLTALKLPVGDAESRTVIFAKPRRLFRKQAYVAISFTRTPGKELNQLQPTAVNRRG